MCSLLYCLLKGAREQSVEEYAGASPVAVKLATGRGRHAAILSLIQSETLQALLQCSRREADRHSSAPHLLCFFAYSCWKEI